MSTNAVQQALGLQSATQTNSPVTPNNGNPNTVYNTPAPTTTAGPTQATAPWIGTMTSNPINMPFNATGLLAPPQFYGTGSGGSAVSDILSRIGSGSFGLPNPGGYTPPPPGTSPPPVTTPGSGTPTAPIGTPVAPISRPIHQNPNAWQSNYANAQPNTSIYESGNGRWGNLPWMPSNPQGPQFNQPNDFGGGLSPEKTLDLYKTGNNYGEFGRKAVDFLMGRDFLPDVTGQNGWKGALSQLANVFLPGGNLIVDTIFGGDETVYSKNPKLFKDKSDQLRQVLMEAKGGNLTKDQIASKLDDLIKNSQQGGGFDYNRYYNAQPAMSNTDWKRTVDRSRFIGMFENGKANDITSQMLKDLQDRLNSVAKTPTWAASKYRR